MPKKIKKSPSKNKHSDAEFMLPDMSAAHGELSAVDRAQDIILDAWEAPTSKKRIALAKKALSVSPDCADAYVLLAEETAKSLEEGITLLRQGVEAGKRALGPETFEQEAGHFWGILETRPYMRALVGLAQGLWEAGARQEAVECYKQMLQLNPNDNQGARYFLITSLLELGRDQEAGELYDQYKDDCSCEWEYSKALLDFRKHGAGPEAKRSLRKAIKGNGHICAYLLKRKTMPIDMPHHYAMGSDEEASLYALFNMDIWRFTPGALEWLAENC